MRLNSLHNALFAAAKLLRAELVAVKLLPSAYVDWSPSDIAVGETSKLQQLGWNDGGEQPQPQGCIERQQALFGVADAFTVYAKPATNSIAVAVSINETILGAMPGQFLQYERRGSSKLALGTLWFAISLEENSPHQDTLFNQERSDDLVELILGVSSQVLWGTYRSAMLQLDSVTELPGSGELRHRLQLNLAALSTGDSSHDSQTLLILLEIDNFSLFRRQLDSAEADRLLKGLTSAMRGAIRRIDGLFRISDSMFAVTADVTGGSERHVLDKLTSAWKTLATETDFFGLTCSIGYRMTGRADTENSLSPSEVPSAQNFMLSAEQALAIAREAGGNRTIEANPELELEAINKGQPANGVFTSDPIKDYRNSRMLWHTTSLIAAETNPGKLCRSFVDLLQDALNFSQADIFTIEDGELYSQTQNPRNGLSPEFRQLVNECLAQKKIQSASISADSTNTIAAVPLVSRGNALGVLLIEAEATTDDSDLLFLRAIADQIAGALDRIELALRQQVLSERESASLRAEIQELKNQATYSADPKDSAPVIAVSQAMRDVLTYVEKIAPTDASILIMGESGAGKEVLAKAIVAASNRADAPLITVDCSAIAHSLIDSELFGRVKGTFTGADAASPGRIAEAHGGTLFLDEIGELPLDVQAKLLRFVQEKELIAVGDTRRRQIDTRIICATNRDLLFESSQGRFRSDLYYRLQVLQVTVPPLRERQADVAALAEAFLKRYSDQFSKPVSGFTDAAWQKIMHYTWPGNVRELQNAIVRATLTAETDLIDAGDLQFGEELPTPEQSVDNLSSTNSRQPVEQLVRSSTADLDRTSQETELGADDWTTLTSLLAGQVSALVAESRLEAPVGRWLADTVVLTAASVSDGVARQAARLLGVPETTLRRQLNKARQNEDNPYQLMSRQWLTTLPALVDLLKTLMTQDDQEIEFAEHCQVLLLQQVANHIGDDRKAGAALMGITPPTYARWLERHAIESQPVSQPATTTTFKLEQKYL